MPTVKQADISTPRAALCRSAASEIVGKATRSNGVIPAANIQSHSFQQRSIIQRKPGEDEELPVQRIPIGNPNNVLKAFRHAQNNNTYSGHRKLPFIQAKLSVNTPGDQYEQEADAMADKVMRIKGPFLPSTYHGVVNIQRKCAACEEEEKHVHRKEESGAEVQTDTGLASYVNSLSSSGQALSKSSRQFFEPRFGQDFSNVRVHTDSTAAKSAKSINALAYTTGNNIVFNEGQYALGSQSGQRLMAHELTHVVQQGGISNAKIQKFESAEHVEIGDATGQSVSGYILLDSHNRDLPNRTSPIAQWAPTMQALFNGGNTEQKRFLKQGLTYGEVLALSGDLFETFDHLNHAPIREIFDLIPLIRTQATTKQLQEATGGRYLSLALRNQAHFSIGKGNNMETWRGRHIEAILIAKSGNANLAYAMNAAADHFLTDRFAAGHLLTQRNSNKSGISRTARALASDDDLLSLSAKLDHDIDNEYGVKVENIRGDHWTALGDENWSAKQNEENRKFAKEATQLSVADIKDAVSQGKSYPAPNDSTVFNSEKIVPKIDTATSVHAHDEATRKKAFETIEKQNPLSEMISSRYLTPDDIVRDWLSRMDDKAVRAQPLTEKIRMVKEVLDGNIDDSDFNAFVRIYQNSSAEERKEIRKTASAAGSLKVNVWLSAMPY
jgi:hypothetical protein